MSEYPNPYESPQMIPVGELASLKIATPVGAGSEDQRRAFPEHSILELRRWKQHGNSLLLFVIAQGFALLITLGVLAFFSMSGKATANTAPYQSLILSALCAALLLEIASIAGVSLRASWAVPVLWFWIGSWLFLCLGGAVAALMLGATELFTGICQLLIYPIILGAFVGKSLLESERVFGPNRIDQRVLTEELAYREMNSIP